MANNYYNNASTVGNQPFPTETVSVIFTNFFSTTNHVSPVLKVHGRDYVIRVNQQQQYQYGHAYGGGNFAVTIEELSSLSTPVEIFPIQNLYNHTTVTSVRVKGSTNISIGLTVGGIVFIGYSYVNQDGSLVFEADIQSAWFSSPDIQHPAWSSSPTKPFRREQILVDLYQDASSETSDVVLSAGQDTNQAHKSILAVRCPKLYEAIQGHDETEAFSISGMGGPVLKSMLDFVYSVKTPDIDSADTAAELILASESFGCLDLNHYVSNIITEKAMVSDVLSKVVALAKTDYGSLCKDLADTDEPQESSAESKPSAHVSGDARHHFTQLKTRLADDPELYLQVLEIFDMYQNHKCDLQDVLATVPALLEGYPGPLLEFTLCLPDDVRSQAIKHLKVPKLDTEATAQTALSQDTKCYVASEVNAVPKASTPFWAKSTAKVHKRNDSKAASSDKSSKLVGVHPLTTKTNGEAKTTAAAKPKTGEETESKAKEGADTKSNAETKAAKKFSDASRVSNDTVLSLPPTLPSPPGSPTSSEDDIARSSEATGSQSEFSERFFFDRKLHAAVREDLRTQEAKLRARKSREQRLADAQEAFRKYSDPNLAVIWTSSKFQIMMRSLGHVYSDDKLGAFLYEICGEYELRSECYNPIREIDFLEWYRDSYDLLFGDEGTNGDHRNDSGDDASGYDGDSAAASETSRFSLVDADDSGHWYA